MDRWVAEECAYREHHDQADQIEDAIETQLEKLLQKQGFHKQNLDRVLEELSGINGEKVELCENFDSSEIDIQSKMENIEEIKKTIEASHTTQSETESKISFVNSVMSMSVPSKNTKRFPSVIPS